VGVEQSNQLERRVSRLLVFSTGRKIGKPACAKLDAEFNALFRGSGIISLKLLDFRSNDTDLDGNLNGKQTRRIPLLGEMACQ
jgi:hypothetical protein